MSIHPKVNGAYKEMTDCKVKVAGEWKQAQTIYTKVNGVWKEVWRNSTVITLTKATTFTLQIQGASGTVKKAEIKNLKLRLYRKNTNELLGSTSFKVVEVSSDVTPIRDVTGTSTSQWFSFAIHLTTPKLTVYATCSYSDLYAEFEYDEVVMIS